MRIRLAFYFSLLIISFSSLGQSQKNPGTKNGLVSPDNIYDIKKVYLEQVLHNPEQEAESENDNELQNFNRWFHLMEPRCYPDGKMPSPDVLLQVMKQEAAKRSVKRTTSTNTWTSLGPNGSVTSLAGIGRVNCIALCPQDSNRVFIGTAGGGIWMSLDAGHTWSTSSDNFPTLSIADIAVNPNHMDTVYAATGDGYGYENGSYNIFWGGLYSAGVMMSTDTGHTWSTTGLSYLQSNTDIIQKLILHPTKTSILMAATRNGLKRSTDAGATWTTVASGHIYSLCFHPTNPDIVYAINTSDLIISTDAGATWTTAYAGLNVSNDRCTIAVSPAAPNNVWVLNSADNLMKSCNQGHTFVPTATSPSTVANFYGYYDRVLAVSPVDSNFVLAFGKDMAYSNSSGNTWAALNPSHNVHSDNHAVLIDPRHPNVIYCGNDGGIFQSLSNGTYWSNISHTLVISQMYRISTSQQSPYTMLVGVQDNGSFYNDGSSWRGSAVPPGDGMDNAINSQNDNIQIGSTQNGTFSISVDRGLTFAPLPVGGTGGDWTAPILFNPNGPDTIYAGMSKIFVSYNAGYSFSAITSAGGFTGGAKCIAVAPGNTSYIYASDYSHISRSTDYGVTWSVVSTGLPTGPCAIMSMAVDYVDPLKVYVTFSGYHATNKVYMTTTGGAPWTNISTGLPNIPINCVAVDSTMPGGLFVGTDIGVYYRDSTTAGWALYNTGLPNVMVSDLDINYTNYMIRAATYGRGVWETKLVKDPPSAVSQVVKTKMDIQINPNPANTVWNLIFKGQKPDNFAIKLFDISGRLILTQSNSEKIDASSLPSGIYHIEVNTGDHTIDLKAIKG